MMTTKTIPAPPKGAAAPRFLIYPHLSCSHLSYPYLSYPGLPLTAHMVAIWLTFGYQLVDIWLPIGCHLVAAWLTVG